jgi:hypothetical protein
MRFYCNALDRDFGRQGHLVGGDRCR